MTFVDKLILIQFRFELGMSKVGYYVTLFTFGMMITTMLTVKGIYVPVWAIVPIALTMLVGLFIFGTYLDIYNVIARINSHMNQRGNPEFATLIETVDRLEKKIDKLEKMLK